MEHYLFISDAAKEVQVESHVLRYWEEELHLPIRRNELGHRYYTFEDVALFKQIKSMKEGGLQLKAIKMILRDGKLNVMTEEGMQIHETQSVQDAEEKEEAGEITVEAAEAEDPGETQNMAIRIVNVDGVPAEETSDEKAKRLQWLLQQLIRETLQENNQEICREIKESVIKELDYQFRVQEEREEERDKLRVQQDEEHFQRLDELLRKKAGRQKLELPKLTGRARGEKRNSRGK